MIHWQSNVPRPEDKVNVLCVYVYIYKCMYMHFNLMTF